MSFLSLSFTDCILFWLENFEHINDKRIQFGETFYEQIENLSDELKKHMGQ